MQSSFRVTIAMSVAVQKFFKQMANLYPYNHFQALGIKFVEYSGKRTKMVLPFNPDLIGDPDHGLIHGGVLTSLLDTCCGCAAVEALDEISIYPTIDLRIDHLRPAVAHQTIYAEAEAFRVTPHIIFCEGLVYQDDPDKPIARCLANFTRLAPEISKSMMEGFKRMAIEDNNND